MNTLLWICQCFLAVVFGYSGFMKSTRNRQKLVQLGQTGVEHLTYPLIRFIGISEILGTASIIIPWATNIWPVLTPIAALCFALIMMLALPIHYRRNEFNSVCLNIVVFAISVFVAYLRYQQLQYY